MSASGIEVRGLLDGEAALYEAMVTERGGTPIEYYRSHYDGLGGSWDDSRVVLMDGKIVSHVRIYDRIVRWGSTTIHCGAMADVYTHPGHRRKGYGRMLLRDSIRRYEAWGCGLSMIISGVYEFYASEGWERYPTYRFDVQIRPEWHKPVSGYHVRRFDRDKDLDAVAEIYAEYNRNSPLTLMRDEHYWRKHFSWARREHEAAFYVAETAGEIVGYMRGDMGTIWEIGYQSDHEKAGLALLEAEVRLMASRGTKQFSIYLPWQEPMIGFLRTLRCHTSLVETTLLRIVDLPLLLESLRPDFEVRLKNCDHPIPPSGSLGFNSGGHQATITVADGQIQVTPGLTQGIEVLQVSQRHLFDLMTGSDEYVPLKLSRPARDLIEVLFPKQNPMWWPIDTV